VYANQCHISTGTATAHTLLPYGIVFLYAQCLFQLMFTNHTAHTTDTTSTKLRNAIRLAATAIASCHSMHHYCCCHCNYNHHYTVFIIGSIAAVDSWRAAYQRLHQSRCRPLCQSVGHTTMYTQPVTLSIFTSLLTVNIYDMYSTLS
jgi:hypothetical protein